MTDIVGILRGLSRPRLLIDAARQGVPGYRRRTHLSRLLNQQALPGPQQAAIHLICLEQDLDEARKTGAAEYSPARHVEIMIALLAETQALLARRDQEKASATSAFLRAV